MSIVILTLVSHLSSTSIGRFDDYIKVIGEFGGHGFPIQNHLWDADRRNWGYGNLPQTLEELKERYQTSIKMLNELRGLGIAGGVFTRKPPMWKGR